MKIRIPLPGRAMSISIALGMLACHSSTMAAFQTSGFLQLRLASRLHSLDACRIPACGTMTQEVLGELLLESQLSREADASLRLEAKKDQASTQSRLSIREGYLDYGIHSGAPLNVRLGRQILTWGVSDYLFVNDIFPKNYDGFFTGSGFDRIKHPVDAIRFTARIDGKASAEKVDAATNDAGLDLEWVLAHPQPDQAPLPQRFVAAASGQHAIVAPSRHQTDVALKLSTRVGSWDMATYLAHFQAREQRFFLDGDGLHLDHPRTTHLGMSFAGNAAGGLIWAEWALRQADQNRSAVLSRYYFGRALKLIAGYSREVIQDTTASAQLQLESNLDHARYQSRLASGIRPVARLNAILHLRLHSRWINQTVGAGAQLFIDSEGARHFNPFGSWSPADGWAIEGGANLFAGRPDTRFGMFKDDSNVYLLGRYSF